MCCQKDHKLQPLVDPSQTEEFGTLHNLVDQFLSEDLSKYLVLYFHLS